MSDIATLSCPTCGGKLEITSNLNRFACSHCGNEHVVRREGGIIALEAVGTRITCPVENHDDMVQKVSAIVSGQTFSVTVMTQESYTYTDSEGKTQVRTQTVPQEGTQVSRLAQKLALPTEPTMPSNWGYVGLRLFLLAVGVTVVYSIAMVVESDAGMYIVCMGGTVLVLFAVPFISNRMYKSRLPQRKAEFEAAHEQWRKAKSKWETCYYCHRHDVVFVVGGSETVAPDDFHSFLYRS